MPRPADEAMGGGGRGGFGPTPGAAENLGQIDVSTIHQLDVNGADAAAKKLAAVFAKPLSIASKDADQRYAAQQDADKNQGQLDAMNGKVDQEQMRSVMGIASAYANGVKMSQTQMKGFDASEKARQLFAANPGASLMDTTDESGNKVPGLHTQIDNIFANAFPGGQEKDPTVANVLGPIMQHTLNEITAASYQHKIKVDQQTAEDSTQASLMHSIQFNTPVSVSMELDKLTKVYGSDPRLGREALVHAVGEASVMTANPEAITKYLPPGIDFGGGATLTPANQQYLDQAKQRALEAQTRGNHVAAQAKLNNVVDTMFTSGKDPSAGIHEYLQMPGATASQGLDVYNWYYRRNKEKQADSVDNNAATWDMDRGIADGSLTNGGQVISFLTERGIGNTKAGNQLLQRGMSNLRSFQNTNADDPDYKAGMSFVASTYNPARDPLSGKFMHDSANSQQAGAMLDFRTMYNSFIKTPNASSTESARKAQKAVLDKWGDSVEDMKGNLKKSGPWNAPASDVDQANVIKNIKSDLAAFHNSGIGARDIDSLRESGMVSNADAARAYDVIQNKLKPK